MSGLFITIEGMDGAGKSTQIKLLEEYLKSCRINVISIRDPGGTSISEKIRNILLDKENRKMDYTTEALLYAASRSQLAKEVILPALKNGEIVLCDRFFDSNLAYQGVARRVGFKNVETINKIALNNFAPDITFLLSISPEESFNRKKTLGGLDRLEQEGFYFYKKVYDGYIQVAKKYSERIYIIDATEKIEQVHKKIIQILNEFLTKNSL